MNLRESIESILKEAALPQVIKGQMFSKEDPPSGYTVTFIKFQQWEAKTPSGESLGIFSMKRYAVNACSRHSIGK